MLSFGEDIGICGALIWKAIKVMMAHCAQRKYSVA